MLDYRDPAFGLRQGALGPDVEFIDLEGRTVIPGLIDSHCHFMEWTLLLGQPDLTVARSEQQVVEILKDSFKETAPGEWILAAGWAHNLWDDPPLPSRASLDAAFPRNPVFLQSKCGHLAWVNRRALEAVGVSASTPDPEGGEIERDASRGGVPTGILKENAIELVASRIGKPGRVERLRALKRGQAEAHSLGLTCVQTAEDLDTWEFFQHALADGALGIRVNFWIPVSALDHVVELKLRHGLGNEWLTLGAIKAFVDGSLGGRTALMYEPLDHETENIGVPVTGLEDLKRYTIRANRAGLPMAVHAIGDRAVGIALSAFDAAQEELGVMGAVGATPPLRNRIEHLQLVDPRDHELLRRVRPVASMQPVHLCADIRPADRYWGRRSRYAYAFRLLADAGCLLAFGSDAPVEPINPFYGIFASVARVSLDLNPQGGWYPEERISVEEALAAYTVGAAEAAGISHDVGQLAAGKLADFVVLERNPTEVHPEELRDIKPLATFVGGECVYSRESAASHEVQ
jgi:predicted amidohydrolase YtcJ